MIPPLGSRSAEIAYDKNAYGLRYLIECFINKIKHYRRVATRYEKTARTFSRWSVSPPLWFGFETLPECQQALAAQRSHPSILRREGRPVHCRGMVPGEGIEPPTFGLQNRCSTAELTRRLFFRLQLAARLCIDKATALANRCARLPDIALTGSIESAREKPAQINITARIPRRINHFRTCFHLGWALGEP